MVLDGKYALNDGNEIPKLGLGTWFVKDRDAADVVRRAVGMGYRLIDTAQAYGNERGVGEGVRTCGVPREEIFVTSKVAAETKTRAAAAKAVDDMLSATGLDNLDLAIIHAPQPWRRWRSKKRRYFEENLDVWAALEDAKAKGKVRSIGVSNFLADDLQNILDNCTVRPAVNQILCHIGNTPEGLLELCRKEGVLAESYAPLGHGRMLEDERVIAMAAKYGVTAAQLCIRYCIELGTVALPKAASDAHLRENAEVDFSISAEDMEALKALPPIKGYGMLRMLPVFSGK